MIRTKTLKQHRKKRRPGNKAMTKAERAHVTEAKFGKCIPCLAWAEAGNMPMEHVAEGVSYDHAKSGNLRIGHMAGFGSCAWHHYGNQRQPPQGWTVARMREHFGPSRMDGSHLFHDAYGSEQDLIDLQARVLGQ